MEKLMIKGLTALCIGSLPFIFRKGPIKILIIAFLFKGIIASLLDNYVVGEGRIKYPVRFFPKHFRLNIVYDYLMYPIIGVLFTRLTYKLKLIPIVLITTCLSLLMTSSQWWLERKTKLFKWQKWSVFHSFFMFMATLLTERGFTELVKKFTKDSPSEKIEPTE